MADNAKRLVPPPVVPAATANKRDESVVPRDDLIGRTIDGRYKVEALLGEGGMGLVYRVRHTSLGKALAIKVLRTNISNDDEVLRRFKQEAQSASHIGNRHIVDVSDFGVTPNGSTYFVMEYLDGVDLITAIEEAGELEDDRVLHIARQLCRAVGAAHDAGIVHRDLKPENVFLVSRDGDDNYVKVLDFGIAKVADSGAKLTRAGEVFGTPHYMSPEQAGGHPVDHRTDIYSLGVIMYEMVTGQVPFDADNMMGILTKHMYEEPLPPSARVPDMLQGLEDVILKCLQKEPQFRYQSLLELEADLDLLEEGLAPAGIQAPKFRATEPPASKPQTVRVAIAAALAVGLLTVGWLTLEGRSASNQTDRRSPEVSPTLVWAQVGSAEAQAVAEPPPAPEPIALSPSVKITSSPRRATVTLNGKRLGRTPVSLSRPDPDKPIVLELAYKGYTTMQSRVTAASLQTEHFELKRAPKKKVTVKRRSRPSKPKKDTPVLDPWD